MADERKFAGTVRGALVVVALLVMVWALYAFFLAYR
jgi:hypothetical protein